MMKHIDHIGIAVNNLDEAVKLYKEILQLEPAAVEEIKEQKVKVSFFQLGEVKIELIEPTDAEGTVAKFIANRGEGLHHIALRVDNIEEELQRIKQSGVRLVDEKPRLGAHGAKIAFLHPKSTKGALLELCERP